VADLLRKAGITAPLEQVAAESAPITELVGERAEHVRPAPIQAAPQQQRSSKPRTGQGQGNGRGGRAGGSGQGSDRNSSSQNRDRAASTSSQGRPVYSTGTGQPSTAHSPRTGQSARPTGSRRAQHNGTRSGAPRG
jgi:hypothetical protein